jgi:uncharacterized protein YndB with AHSA1/START domain
MTDRSIEHEIEVPGTPEEVWDAIATGQGITAWWIPAKVEEHAGGKLELDFGPGFGTAIGQVTAWQPPHRFAYTAPGGSGSSSAYEWLVEAHAGGTCLVRLVNSGFLTEEDWKAEYEATYEGWKLFFFNLRLYVTHFAHQRCTSMLVHGMSNQPRPEAWQKLSSSLGLPLAPALGERVTVAAAGVPSLDGRVERFQSDLVTLLVDSPAPGIAFIGTEVFGDTVMLLVYLYLYGDSAPAAIERDEPAWRAWMERTFAPLSDVTA